MKVLRDGRWNEQDAALLVPGDIISIKLGDIIPADARLLEGDPLKIDQVGLLLLRVYCCTMYINHWICWILAVFLMFCFGFHSLRLLVSPFRSQKALEMVSTLVQLANREKLKQWSLPQVSIPSLGRLLILLTPPTKWATSKRQGDWCTRNSLCLLYNLSFMNFVPNLFLLFGSVGLDCHWELLYMFNCYWDDYRNYCYVSHSRSRVPPWNWQPSCASHWRNSDCHAYGSVSDNGYWFS